MLVAVIAIGLLSLQLSEMIVFLLGDLFEPSTSFFPQPDHDSTES